MSASQTPIFELLGQFGHQNLFFCNDEVVGLKAIVAIHDTTLGPAIGGVRMLPYSSTEEAIEDALRLSRAITYKSAITGLNLGGGSAVIIGNHRIDKSEVLLRRLGQFIEGLNGNFIASIDVGIGQRDLEHIFTETSHVAGLPKAINGGGDTSIFAAQGVLYGIKASLKELYGSDSLAGRKVIVHGIGSVGERLIEMLRDENSRVYVSDITEDRMLKTAAKYKVETIAFDKVFDFDCDVYAPCALGGTVNPETAAKMQCKIIAGAANNQLKDELVTSNILHERGILYAPDYLINAGALVSCYSEIQGYGADHTEFVIKNIYNATREVLQKSKQENISSFQAANQIAEKRIFDIRKLKR
ncbi:Glu/Leu/Phe/Val family dehydrogenase [Sphingobacterium anhuiense]|uniref:Glu/Leu/Phe/Val dehydrogenase n=1 Tax=Sphingobacterium anhuiense TaxID=493780 RepID=A0ABW5YXW7_9SPHI